LGVTVKTDSQSAPGAFARQSFWRRTLPRIGLRWWDLSADEPQQFPDSGEPENYILGQTDSPTASAALWEVVVPPTATILHRRTIADSYKELKLDNTTAIVD